MPKRELLHEWMHRFEGYYGQLRVWTQRAGDVKEFLAQNAEIGKLLETKPIDDLLAAVAALPYVNAVEQLDDWGNGRLVYVDWP